MLTKLQHLRSEVHTAVLLTVQVFWDMTPCQWVVKSPRFEGRVFLYFESHVAWHGFTRRLMFSETHRKKQANEQEQDPLRSTCLSERIILKKISKNILNRKCLAQFNSTTKSASYRVPTATSPNHLLLMFPVASQSSPGFSMFSLFLISRDTIFWKAGLISDPGWKIHPPCLCAAITSIAKQKHAKVFSHPTLFDLLNNTILWRVPRTQRLYFLWHQSADESEQEHWWNHTAGEKPKY